MQKKNSDLQIRRAILDPTSALTFFLMEALPDGRVGLGDRMLIVHSLVFDTCRRFATLSHGLVAIS
jgi:hypothetical protein